MPRQHSSPVPKDESAEPREESSHWTGHTATTATLFVCVYILSGESALEDMTHYVYVYMFGCPVNHTFKPANPNLLKKYYLCGFSGSEGLSNDQTTPSIQNIASKFFGGLIKLFCDFFQKKCDKTTNF